MELYLQYAVLWYHIVATVYAVGTFIFKVSPCYVHLSVRLSPVIRFVQLKNLHLSLQNVCDVSNVQFYVRNPFFLLME